MTAPRGWPWLAALALAGCGDGSPEVLLGTLERDRVELVAESQEPIIAIGVREGEAVAAGQLLLQLDPVAQETRVAQARAAAGQAGQRLAELLAGARSEQLREARAQREAAEARALAEHREFDRVDALVAQKLLPQSQRDRQLSLRDGAAAEARAAAERLALLERGTRDEVIAQARAAEAQALAQVAELEVSLGRLSVTAPRDGTIDALPYELGERPPRGAPVAILLAAGQPHARVFVPQPMRARLAPGVAARVRIAGLAREYRAELRHVSAEAAFTPYFALNERDRSHLSFLAEVVLTEPEAAALPTGMPVEVRFAPAAGP